MLLPAFFHSLRARLLLLVGVAVLPLSLFALAGVVSLAQAKREDFTRSLADVVRALGSAVDAELRRSVSVVEALAASPLLVRGDFAGFHELASTVTQRQPHWVSMALATPDGRYLLNTARPYGSELPPRVSDLQALEAVRSTSQPWIGQLRRGQVAGEALFTVASPVRIAGQVRYVLFAGVRPEAIREILARQHIPSEATVAVLDRERKILARSRQHERFLGNPATESLQQIMRGRLEGSGTPRTLDGRPTYAAFSTSPQTGLSVVIGVQHEQMGAAQGPAYAVLLLGLLASLLLGGLVAFVLAGRIVRPIHALREATRAIADGELAQEPDTPLPEIREVGRALAQASVQLREAAQLRTRVLEAEQQARLAAERASREKDEFLAMLGHELRNPLAAIHNAFELMRRLPPQHERTGAVQQVMARQLGHLKHLLDDLLDVSRVATGKIELQCRPLDLAVVTRDAVQALEQAGGLQDHRLSLQTAPAWLLGDPVRLQQVASNLLSNAAKYSPAGTTIEVRVGPAEDGQAELEIADQGVGMEPQVLERAFDLFYQAGVGADRAQGGLGVGLTLSKRLVELHGGTISASSAGRDRGSRFTVRLPASQGAPALGNAAGRAPGQAPRRVLVVDDNRDSAHTLKLLLELDGHQVETAHDGAEAVAKARALRPELILLDLGLPVLDGYGVCRAIRAFPFGAEPRIIAVSGWGQPADRERSSQAGFDAHLTKPVDHQELLDAIQRVAPQPAADGMAAG